METNPVRKRMRALLSSRVVVRRFSALVRQPFFIALTVFGNGCILAAAVFFYHLEIGVNPEVHSFLDTLHWAVSSVTTVGHSPVYPVTTAGKWLSIAVMLGGSLFLWLYMALFVSALIAPELGLVESEIHGIESELKRIGPEERGELPPSPKM